MNLTDLYHHSYVPYSGEPAVAVVVSAQGRHYPGVRIENISFPLSISAIQNALFHCLASGDEPAVAHTDAGRDSPGMAYWREQYNLDIRPLDALSAFQFEPADIVLPIDDMRDALASLRSKAVVDESHFSVAALLQTSHGFIPGVNIETADWSRGLCAERVALARAMTYGISGRDITMLAVNTQSGEYCSPCGACRQVLAEHLTHHPLYFYHPDGTHSHHLISDLLPYNFQSNALKLDTPF